MLDKVVANGKKVGYNFGVGALDAIDKKRGIRMKKVGFKKGFTLAEILIVVSVIGVVATTAIPPLIENINERVWAARSQDTLAKLSEATNQMKVDDMLSGFANTDAFVNELEKKIRVTKRCDAQNLDKCFVPKFKSGEDTIETKTLKAIKNIWKTSTDTNNATVGLVTIDGTPMVIAFDQTCERLDPFSNTPRGTNGISATLGCLHMLFDTNGSAKPNTIGKDIKDYQIALAKGMDCTKVPSGGPCFAKTDVAIKPINTCDPNLVLDNGKKASDYDNTGTSNSWCSDNRWAGAMKACDDADMTLPTMAQLAQLATDVYNTPIGAMEHKNPATMDTTKATKYGLNTAGSYLWSSEQYGTHSAYYRGFYPSYSNYTNSYKYYTTPVARCVAK